uniref:Uncharacterized protein n=1 Tax=Panagrolaimus davidi TaxID=227884 RepID=A0A914PZ57_9BILA
MLVQSLVDATNLKPEHLIKFYQCCKHFYAKFRRNIIRHLEIVPDGEKETLDPTKTVICVSNHVLSTIKDFWLTDSYTNHGGIALLPEFFHCCIKKLESLNGIDWSGYKKLAKAGTVEELNIAECLYFPVEYGYVMYAPVESIYVIYCFLCFCMLKFCQLHLYKFTNTIVVCWLKKWLKRVDKI